MSDFSIGFANPWLLFLLIPALLLTLIPFLRLPKKFRRTRNRVISVVLHTLCVTLCVTLIAGISFSYTVPNRENELLIVVDASDSGSEQSDTRDDYIQSIVNVCGKNDKIGIVTFGLEPVYAAPLSYDAREAYRQYLGAQTPDTSATNISAALKFAAEQFTNPKTSKIVLLSDGFETDEDALTTAQIISATGVKIDTVCFPDEERGEIQLTGASLPSDRVVLGQTVNLSLTVESSIEEPTNVTVTLSDKQFADEPLSFTLQKGEQTLTIPHVFQSAGMHDLLVTIESGNDFVTQNNVFQTSLDISVFEDILILENHVGEAAELEGILSENYTVRVMNIHDDIASLPATAKELCAYQQVVLVNIANSDLKAPGMPEGFDQALYEYVYDLGGSMLTVGGENDIGADGNPVPHAYNREDLAGSLLQEMLPVQAIDYSPPIAVMLVIDCSGSMSQGRFEAALQGAEETLDTLSDRDYCGVMSFSTSATEEVTVLPVSQKETIRDAIRHLGEGEDSAGSGGTVFSPAIDRAGRALAPIDVDRKHIILITDGNPSDHLEANSDNDSNTYGKYVDWNYERGITMSVITLGLSGNDSNFTQMEKTAERGHGNHYNVTLPIAAGAVGSYMQQDLASVTLSEMQDGIEFTPSIGDQSPIFAGMDASVILPMLNGYYGTRVKDDSVSVPLVYEYIPIYASWKFGAGNVGSFMCDLSGYWSAEFIADAIGRQLVKNIAESLAPLQPPEPDRNDFVWEKTTDNYSTRLNVFTDCKEGESVRVSVTPLSDAAKNYYASGVEVVPVGNNVGFNFSIMCTGVYSILIEKIDAEGNVLADITLTQTFSYSDEYDAIRDARDGADFLSSLAQSGGGAVITDPVEIFATFEKFLRKTTNPALPFLIVIMVCILLDIAVRKFKFKWLHEIIRDKKAMKELNDTNTKAQGEK